MDVAIVGDRYLATLFRLLGIETVEVDDPESAVTKVKQLAEAGDCKVLLITERVALRLRAFSARAQPVYQML